MVSLWNKDWFHAVYEIAYTDGNWRGIYWRRDVMPVEEGGFVVIPEYKHRARILFGILFQY